MSKPVAEQVEDSMVELALLLIDPATPDVVRPALRGLLGIRRMQRDLLALAEPQRT